MPEDGNHELSILGTLLWSLRAAMDEGWGVEARRCGVICHGHRSKAIRSLGDRSWRTGHTHSVLARRCRRIAAAPGLEAVELSCRRLGLGGGLRRLSILLDALPVA